MTAYQNRIKEIDMTRELDTIKAGDIVTVVRTNGGGTYSIVSGPALAAPDLDPAIGIDLLDGEPHILRRSDGEVFGDIVELHVQREGHRHIWEDLEKRIEPSIRKKVEREIRIEAAKRAHPAGGASPKQLVDGIRLAAYLARGANPERDPMWDNDCTICQGGGCLDCTDRSD